MLFIYFQLDKGKFYLHTSFMQMKQSINEHRLLTVFVFLLMGLNWFLEAIKWKLLMKEIEAFSWLRSFRSIFAGLSIAMITPNRLGEFGGRILFLKEKNRAKGSVIFFIGSFAQLLITILAGLLAFLYFNMRILPGNFFSTYILCISEGILLLLLCYLFFNLNLLSSYLSKFKRLNKFREFTELFSQYHYRQLVPIFLLSLFRFLVFTSQYFLLLTIFVGDIPIIKTTSLIALIFFAQSFIPSFLLSDVGIRGATGTFFLSYVSSNTPAILVSAFSLWLINIILPALIGLIFILRHNFFGNNADH